MSITYAWAETGHPNCRRPDKVIDARQLAFIRRVGVTQKAQPTLHETIAYIRPFLIEAMIEGAETKP